MPVDDRHGLEDLKRDVRLYGATLALAEADGPEDLSRAAAKLVGDVTGALESYVELFDDDAEGLARWSAWDGCDEDRVEEIRTVISRGIIAEAIATGRVVVTASALADPRFGDLESVRAWGIHAVLCAPLGGDTPIGALYVQGRRGAEAGLPFDEDARARIERLARWLTPLAEAMIARARGRGAGGRSEPTTQGDAFSALIARSASFRQMIERLRHAARLDVHLLMTGPSGVGKTMLAQAVHTASARARRPFVEINCAALPDTLLENELFGADPGAHSTVPRGGSRGKVEAAEGGTLFLDEVSELSPSAQAKLLQLLQSKTYYRLGSAQARRADVRFIAATNASLAERVAEKRFREDLYYRLRVLEVRVPTLAERAEDTVPLAVKLCRDACLRHDLASIPLAPSALRAIRVAEWPGNVRELEHRIEAAVIDAHLRGARAVEARDVFPEVAASGDEPLTLQEATRRFQRRHLAVVLDSTDWNVTEAARVLDVARSHVYNLIRTFGLSRGS